MAQQVLDLFPLSRSFGFSSPNAFWCGASLSDCVFSFFLYLIAVWIFEFAFSLIWLKGEGWPLGLQPLNVRVGVPGNRDCLGSVSFSTLMTASPVSFTDSSTDLDTEVCSLIDYRTYLLCFLVALATKWCLLWVPACYYCFSLISVSVWTSLHPPPTILIEQSSNPIDHTFGCQDKWWSI